MTTARYSAKRSVTAVDLADREAKVEVRILPGRGNRASAMKVQGVNILWFPAEDADVADRPRLNGIPFLAPWGNRLDAGFQSSGKWHALDAAGLRRDANGLPIHGLLTASALWAVVDLAEDEKQASVTSRLNFGAHPELMAHWPYRHEYEMTYRLAGGALEVSTTIRNTGDEAMPVAIGFHPYFVLPGVSRDEVAVRVPASSHVDTDAKLLATGAFTANQLPEWVPLRSHPLDDGFTDLIRDPDGRARFSISAGSRGIHVDFGPRYSVAIVYAPPGERYVCVEPMTAITNGINLAAEGKYRDLQTVDPGEVWQESFRISTEGL